MKRINGKQLIIFDCDGVLFHSEDANMAYFETCLEKTARVPLKGNLRKQAAYMSVRQLFQQILDNPSDVEEAYQISQKIPYDPYLPLIKPTFNFDELLLPVKEEKYLAIATNRGQSLTKLFKYFNLFKYFHYKVSAYDNPPKPAPDMLYACCDYFGESPKSALFIGDSASDGEAASSAGIDYIHIGNHDTFNCIKSMPELFK